MPFTLIRTYFYLWFDFVSTQVGLLFLFMKNSQKHNFLQIHIATIEILNLLDKFSMVSIRYRCFQVFFKNIYLMSLDKMTICDWIHLNICNKSNIEHSYRNPKIAPASPPNTSAKSGLRSRCLILCSKNLLHSMVDFTPHCSHCGSGMVQKVRMKSSKRISWSILFWKIHQFLYKPVGITFEINFSTSYKFSI